MPALNFQARFAPLVESGEKLQTIRANRKDGRNPKAGDRLYLYTGMRTKACRLLREAVCSSVSPVAIGERAIWINGVPQGGWAADCRAREDGFDSYAAMVEWFRTVHGLPFSGFLIRWGR